MAVYVLNALILPVDFERYERVTIEIRKASVEEVRRLLQNNQFVSAVGHQATAVLLTQLLGVLVPMNRITVKAQPGDILVHFVLKERLPEGKVLSYEELRQLADASQFDLAISEVLKA
jgi:hypothetical protein